VLAFEEQLEPAAAVLYRRAMMALQDRGVEFLVGGGFALAHYTETLRDPHDFDLFLRRRDVAPALEALAAAGYRTELTFGHWLGKAYEGDRFIDIIFGSGNGLAAVDDGWFAHARPATILGLSGALCPPEEMIWSKAFILERERFDGADINHLLRDCGRDLDWERLVGRFGPHYRVLLAHLVLFGYVYPGERGLVPPAVLAQLAARLLEERPERGSHVCQGTLVSREQYLNDIERQGYEDARLARVDVDMTAQDIATWTAAIPGRKPALVPTPPAPPAPRRRPRR
jgi:hypothetical protein